MIPDKAFTLVEATIAEKKLELIILIFCFILRKTI